MGTDCLTKAMGYDRALDKQAAGLVRQVFCNPRCERGVLSPHPDAERLNPPRRNGAHRSGC